jgi:hypothetical protein
MFPAPDLFAKALALLAFVVAFYALAARERKTPYLTNSLYPTVFWICFASVLLMAAQIIERSHTSTAGWLNGIAQGLLVLGALNITYRIWRVHNRHVNFHDENLFKNLRPIRSFKALRRYLSKKRSYEHDAPSLFPELQTAISGLGTENPLSKLGGVADDTFPKSVAYEGASLADSDYTLIELAKGLLSQGWGVQYMTCIRHPIEFVSKLQAALSSGGLKPRMSELLGQVVVIDGYTPHFGFTDSIHAKRAREVTKIGVEYIKSRPSFAGVHTSTAKAFNKFKKQHEARGLSRKPTLVIYEGAYALVALESVEQYYIFLRHVLPSERMWGGMLTFFVEPNICDEAAGLLSTYSDVLLDRRSASYDSK